MLWQIYPMAISRAACQDVNFLKSSDMKRICETELVRMNTTIQLCETAHLIRKNGARLQDRLPAPAKRLMGGYPGGRKVGPAGNFRLSA